MIEAEFVEVADVRIGEGDVADRGDRESGGNGVAGDAEGAKPGPAICRCGRKMRMAPSVLAQGPVQCGLCGQDFSTERHKDPADSTGRALGWTPSGTGPSSLESEQRVGKGAGGPVPAVDVNEPTEHERSSLLLLSDLAGTASGLTLIAEVGAWREARRRDDPRPLVAASPDGVDRANAAARALLKLDGELKGAAIVVAGRELIVGESVVVGGRIDQLFDVDGLELPPSGVMGTIVAIDGSRGFLDVEFPIAGRCRLAAESPAAAALEYGYAERAGLVGAPLIDVRTLPEAAPVAMSDVREVPELSW